jgi:hypothetical protein
MEQKIEYLYKAVAHLRVDQKALDIENAVLKMKTQLQQKEIEKKGDEIFNLNNEVHKLRQELIHKKRDYEIMSEQYEHASKYATETSERHQKDQLFIQDAIAKRQKARAAYRDIVNGCGNTDHNPSLRDALTVLRECLKESSSSSN